MLDNLAIMITLGIVGIAAMIFSAEYVVDRLVALAHHYGVSDTFIGLTVLSIGTSLPEIGSHVMASIGILTGGMDYRIASSTVLGANIGSDVVQQTLMVGFVVLIAGGMTFTKDFMKKSYTVMVGTTLMCIVLGWDRTYSRVDGLILLATMGLYLWFLARDEKEHPVPKIELKQKPWIAILFVLGGMAVLLGSSALVLHIVELFVYATGIHGGLIGVVILGVASALPEFITAITGLRKKAQGISVGTLIGSNITNPLVAIGGGSLISTYFVPAPLILWDLPMETITGALLALWIFKHKGKLGRGGGIYLIALYIVYLYVRIVYFPHDF